jgi:prepilin signal peptidase PulO-like enzyme (type II secretory pathway)
MLLFYFLVFFVFGTVIGSFLNVVILRHNTGRFINGRSFCTSCGKMLKWFELLPVVSFFFLKGRCKGCRSKISWQYPLVEFFTGMIFILIFLKFNDLPIIPNSHFLIPVLYSLVVWCLLMVIFVYDLKHKIIPDNFVYSFIAVSFLFRLSQTDLTHFLSYPNLLNLAAGPILFLPFFLLWFLSDGKWMGFGDGKLALGIGFMLGIYGGLSAVVVGFWIGAVVSIFRLLFVGAVRKGLLPFVLLNSTLKNLTMKSEVAFAPFLILGILAVYFFGINVIIW